MEKKNNLDPQYNNLLEDILENGIKKQTRNGEVISVFGRQVRHKMSDGFPLLTGKKMFFKGVVTELLWFLRGDTNIQYLVQNGCNIWNGDAYKAYHSRFPETEMMSEQDFIETIRVNDEFAKKWGDLGPIYGHQWRNWNGKVEVKITNERDEKGYLKYKTEHKKGIDQIQNLINDLKTNPDSRRLMVNAWNVGELDQMVLPPCHYGFQVYTRELNWYDDLDKIKEIYVNWSLAKSSYGYAGDIKADTIKLANQIFIDGWENNKDPFTGKPLIELECFSSIPKRAISLMWNQRSVDTFLGLPFNIASYGLLLEIIAKEVNMVPDELIGNLGDVHLYSNHIEQAKEQIGRELTVEERNEWHLINRCGGNKRDCKTDWKDFELDQQNIPKRTREPYSLPTLKLGHFGSILENISVVDLSDFQIENYQSHPAIKAPLSN